MSKLKTIIVIVVILAIGFFAYSYFFVSNEDTSANLKDVSKPTTTGTVTDSTKAIVPVSKELSQNEQYVKQLIALRAISFNFDLFNDDAYKILHAANTDISPEEKGRHNPFAPIETGDGDYINVASTTPPGFQLTSTSTLPKPKTTQ